jgi:hypothetical protein
MGLDLLVVRRAKPGRESEWREILERYFADEELIEADKARFEEISIAALQSIDAPRVGFDPESDAWSVAARNSKAPEEI